MHARRVAGLDRRGDGALPLEVAPVEHAHETEVEEAHPPVLEQQVVAGMGIARDAAHVLDEAEVEPEDDLAEAVPRGRVAALDLLEPLAGQQVGDEDASSRELGVDLRDVGEGMAAVGARHGTLVLGLELVVELLGDPFAQLARTAP